MKHEDFSSLFPICQVRVFRLYDLYVNCPVSFYSCTPSSSAHHRQLASLIYATPSLVWLSGWTRAEWRAPRLSGRPDHQLHRITENARCRMSILSNGTPEYFSEYMSDRMPQYMLDRKSEYMSEGMPRWGSLEEINFL